MSVFFWFILYLLSGFESQMLRLNQLVSSWFMHDVKYLCRCYPQVVIIVPIYDRNQLTWRFLCENAICSLTQRVYFWRREKLILLRFILFSGTYNNCVICTEWKFFMKWWKRIKWYSVIDEHQRDFTLSYSMKCNGHS